MCPVGCHCLVVGALSLGCCFKHVTNVFAYSAIEMGGVFTNKTNVHNYEAKTDKVGLQGLFTTCTVSYISSSNVY